MVNQCENDKRKKLETEIEKRQCLKSLSSQFLF